LNPIRVSVVSYLNSRPFLYGLHLLGVDELAEISEDHPAACAQKLISGEADLGLVPVGMLPEIPNARIVSNYCIGTEGEVGTVCIFSERPLRDLTGLMLDYESRTSVALVKVLLDKYWGVSPRLIAGEPGFETKIRGQVGGLVIGDRAIALTGEFPYVYDLGSAWRQFTGLPFVFAVWVANKPLPAYFLDRFEAALDAGVAAIPKLVMLYESPHPDFSLEQYYTRRISYRLDAQKKQALSLFLQTIGKPWDWQ
jgi:chorismate dehydratase